MRGLTIAAMASLAGLAMPGDILRTPRPVPAYPPPTDPEVETRQMRRARDRAYFKRIARIEAPKGSGGRRWRRKPKLRGVTGWRKPIKNPEKFLNSCAARTAWLIFKDGRGK